MRLFRTSPAEESAAAAYRSVVAHSRNPDFFAKFGVPDTLDGRFELICLHAFLYLHRLKRERPSADALSQHFVDLVFVDMDRSLRELGTGDLSVGRQVKRMAQALYGRIDAYEKALAEDRATLAAALARNLFGTVSEPERYSDDMALYVQRQAALLRTERVSDLLAGRVIFSPPALDQRVAPSTVAEAEAT